MEAVADRGGTPQASFIDAGLITPQALEAGLAEMRELAEDESMLALMPRMAQVWARKPGLSGRTRRLHTPAGPPLALGPRRVRRTAPDSPA